MNRKDYIVGIASLIEHYRKGELTINLDENHVEKWVRQFDESEQIVVLEETFNALNKFYKNLDIMKNMLDEQVKKLICLVDKNSIEFLEIQKKGSSQKLLLNFTEEIWKSNTGQKIIIKSDNEFSTDKRYVYLDDFSFTGRHLREDILSLIEKLDKGSKLTIVLLFTYSDCYSYTKEKIDEKAKIKNIDITFVIGEILNDNKKDSNEKIDVIWPCKLIKKDEEVFTYENKLIETKKARYLYRYEQEKFRSNLFSSIENEMEISRIFLKYGIRIINNIKSTEMKPLGYNIGTNFGFGAICATDLNIPNNCPIVLWWGQVDDRNINTN